MFLGSKFCGHCGSKASAVEVFSDDQGGDCPRCKRPLESIRIETTHVRECASCGGFWTSAQTFESLCADKEAQSAVMNFINTQTLHSRDIAPVSYVPCPDCKQLMNRSNFARVSGIIVDLCKQHGVWFDAEELPKIIEFIDGGGLVRAREKEKVALEEERSRLREEQHKLAMMERRSGAGRFKDDGQDTAFGRVISALFDL